jgi:hypothetical protein
MVVRRTLTFPIGGTMRSTLLLLLAMATLGAVLAPSARAQTQADSTAIRAAALDYIEGWYSGDPERMTRALHPALVKRIVAVNRETGEAFVDDMGAGKLVAGTRAAYGHETPEDQRRTDVTIFDVFGNAASVKIDAGGWVDYLHLAKIDGRWMILNVLWELRR